MKKSIFTDISTAPSPRALKWADKEVSILSSILLWGLWLCRLVSLLQILKLVYRRVAMLVRRASTDKGAKRPNVPPMFCEIYFILWLLAMICGYALFPDALVIHILAPYFLFESIVWVLYYTIFRRFYEERYSIYHELEYLSVLILVIPTQALAFAIVYGMEFGEVLSGLLGAGSDATPIVVRVFGALFAAIVVSMIISAFPTERVKKHEPEKMQLIIGCGDVVEKRLYPALLGAGHKEENVLGFDLCSSARRLPYATYHEDGGEILAAVRSKVTEASTIYIETPPSSHIDYLKDALMTSARLIVVEKPITVSLDELNYLEEAIESPAVRERIFFASYYILEKALPLYFLCDYNASYLPYLNIEDKYLARSWRASLGVPTRVEVYLGERRDEREWANGASGQMYETFIHNMLIASLFVGTPEHWSDVEIKESDASGITEISLSARCGTADISLLMRKNLPDDEVRRYAVIEFSGGSIRADFDKEDAEVHFLDTGRTSRVSIKHNYTKKYSVIADLIRRTSEGECAADDVDGLVNQINTLRWLIGRETSKEEKND